jgi:hypothetical protein
MDLEAYCLPDSLAQLPLSQATQLRGLSIWEIRHAWEQPSYHLCALASLTHLQKLQIPGDWCLGFTALTTLTALTHLHLRSMGRHSTEQQAATSSTQSALAATLPACAGLKELHLPGVHSGPLTVALSQLTRLTQLRIKQLAGISSAAPLVLPSAHILEVPRLSLSALCGLQAPSLQHVSVKLEISSGQVNEFRQLPWALLQHCADLTVTVSGQQGIPEQEVITLMTALRDFWRPTSTATNDYHSVDLHRRRWSADKARPAWVLTLRQLPCSQSVLQNVPTGVTYLELS